MIIRTLALLCVVAVIMAIAPAAAQDAPTAQTTARINVRTGPAITEFIIAAVPAGTTVILEGRNAAGDWALAHTAGDAAGSLRGWMAARYLAPAEGVRLDALPVTEEVLEIFSSVEPAPPAVENSGENEEVTEQPPPAPAGETNATVTRDVNLREGAGQGYGIIAVLPDGTRVAVEEHTEDNNWARVHTEDGSLRGWVSARFIMDDDFYMPPPVVPVSARVREIYLHGQELGNNPHAFSKLGDCNSLVPFFLTSFDTGAYRLGEYAYLQPVINHFAGSFMRSSMATRGSARSYMVFDATWSDPRYCNHGETPIACEYRLNRPSVVFVSFGTHDRPEDFPDDLRAIVDFSIERGVIPILGTKADFSYGWDQPNNATIRQMAAEYEIPLWDFCAATRDLPNFGLRSDGGRLSWFWPDYTDPQALQSGFGVRNLTALQMLDAVWRGAMQP